MKGDKFNFYGGAGWIAIAMLVIAFYGDPDLHTALIAWLLAGAAL